MKKLSRKIIVLAYLTILLFGLLTPFNQSFAQDTVILSSSPASPRTTNIGNPTQITATLIVADGKAKTIKFHTVGGGKTYSFSSETCEIPTGKTFCTVLFTSFDEGTFFIGANVSAKDDFPSTATGVNVEFIDPSKKTVGTETDTTYIPLAPLPGLGNTTCKDIDGKTVSCIETDKTKNACPFGDYINIMIKIIIGIAAVLAMVMIVMGGIQYMTSELVSGKEAGKETITHAILGLLIALGAYLILNTINPQLLSVCLDKLPTATITITPYDPNTNSYIVKTSGNCSVITSGDCSPSNFKSLNIFGGKENNASMICNVESGGIVDKKSNSDYCSVGQTTFSFGLFQINLLVHGDKIPSSVGNCANLFTTGAGKEIGVGKSGYVVKNEKGSYSYDCKLKPDRGDDYNKCSNYLKTASGNLLVASKLFQGRVFEDWRQSDQRVCSAAFQ